LCGDGSHIFNLSGADWVGTVLTFLTPPCTEIVTNIEFYCIV
jgi:hypothetical protein